LLRVADGAVPRLADFCLIHLVSGRDIACAAAVHCTPDGQRIVRSLARLYRIRRGDRLSTVATVVATGRAAVRNVIQIDRASPRPDAVSQLHRQLDPRSVLVVPVLNNGRAVGAVSLGYAASGRAYSARDLPAGRELAARVAQALRFARDSDARLRPPISRPRQGTALRRRLAPRN
jgi:GAF domain-containing protein